ncbi:MAG: RagB/SusD family nutrient uptake outer membrane protein [Bacteroidales bacterium]
MRKNIISIGCLLALLSAPSCSDDFLKVDSPDKLLVDEYYSTESRIFEALVAAYDPLQWFDWGMGEYNPLNVMSDIMADDVWVGGSDKTDNQPWHLMMNYEALPNAVISGLWIEAYSGINRSNNVLQYMGGVKNISEKNKALYLAEAQVLRSYYYNILWKFWGNVPYYATNLEFPYITGQNTADEVYDFVVNDLEDAIENGGLPMVAESSKVGRVTKAMAYMLYAEVVMYQNDESRFNKALGFMEEIINSGQYALEEDFEKIFKAEGEWCSESIWEINYKNEGAVRSWGAPLVAGGTVLPRLISPKDWKDGDDERDNGWGFEPVRAEAYEMYAEGDIRREGTIYDGRAHKYTERYQNTGFFLNKYMARTGYNANQLADADLNFGNNLRIYRFSETLLNAAELLVRGASGSGSAADYLNRVHHRAGLTDVVAPSLENILQERRLEFVGEGKRYWDLIRTGKAASVLVPDAYGYRTNSWTANKKYLPIPQTEIDASQNTLTQNNY